MKNCIILFLVLLFIVGCVPKPIYIGKYGSKESPHGLQINKDSTFNYKFYQFHVYEYSNGKWRTDRNGKLMLNSFDKNIKLPLLVTAKTYTNDNINKYSFNFKSDKIELKDLECAIFINDTLSQVQRCDSISSIQIHTPVKQLFIQVRKSPLLITSFRFSPEPLTTEIFTASQESGNSINFDVIIKDSFFSYKVFSDEQVRVKKGGLYFYNDKANRRYWVPKIE